MDDMTNTVLYRKQKITRKTKQIKDTYTITHSTCSGLYYGFMGPLATGCHAKMFGWAKSLPLPYLPFSPPLSSLPLGAGPLNTAGESGECCKLPQRGVEQPQQKANLVHFSLES